MRLDADIPSPVNGYARVFLDGRELNHVCVADEEGGYVIMFAMNEEGLFINGKCAFKVVRVGKVEIVIPDEYKPIVDSLQKLSS